MFIFLETDSFEAKSRLSGAVARGEQKSKLGKEFAPIRRPYRGIQVKEDTYAVLSVRKASGEAIPLVSSSEVRQETTGASGVGAIGTVSEYADFILQSVEDTRMEKQQIIETFGDTFVYFFGERPRMVTISGLLMNTEDFNWRAQFWHNYDNFFRGSKLVQMNARCYLAYDTVVIEGYPLSASASDNSENPYSIPFQMTMLMTDYHEYSTVGDIHFPGLNSESIDILNDELAKRRQSFVSTGSEVRQANLNAATSNQLHTENSALALLRKGTRAFNRAATFLGDKLDIVNRLLGGRTLRLPIGAAGFLAAQGPAQLAPASLITTGNSRFDQDIADQQFAGVSGRFGKVEINGVPIFGPKLRIMGPSRFGPSWISQVTKTSRGMIYENYDEYPTRQLQKLTDLLTPDQFGVFEDLRRERFVKMSARQQSLINLNILAANGGALQNIAEVVSVIRAGYGMFLTASNFISDPAGVATAALGITPADVSRAASSVSSGVEKLVNIGDGLRKGDFVPALDAFIGQRTRRTWENWIENIADGNVRALFEKNQTEVGAATIGDVYNSNEYTLTAAEEGEKDYDLAYGTSDYTPLIESQEAVDAETLLAEGDLPDDVDRTEPNADKIEASLDEVYGNTDSAAFGSGSDDPATLDEVYGQEGTIQTITPSAEEQAALLDAVYNNRETSRSSEDTSGIRDADADDAAIDPVV